MSERRSSFDAEMQQEILEIVSSLEEMHIKISSDLVKNLPFPNIESYKDDVIEKGLLSLTDRIEDLQRKLVSNDQQILSLTELCPLSIDFCVTSTSVFFH